MSEPKGQLRDSERVILKVMRTREEWRFHELLDELSKGRKEPMTANALAVHFNNLRKLGYVIKRHHVYVLQEE